MSAQTNQIYSRTVVGFWIYLMTDCLLFATLFATYVVLKPNTFGGPGSSDIYNAHYALAQTLVLLLSSFAAGPALMNAERKKIKATYFWFAIAFIFGVIFLILEIKEFSILLAEGNSWKRSAFLSSYFTLVGTHGTHILFGLIWMVVFFLQLRFSGLKPEIVRRATLLSIYWHFLDVVWIFIFTVVYLMGVI